DAHSAGNRGDRSAERRNRVVPGYRRRHPADSRELLLSRPLPAGPVGRPPARRWCDERRDTGSADARTGGDPRDRGAVAVTALPPDAEERVPGRPPVLPDHAGTL